MNPVFVKELRIGTRERKLPLVFTVYLVVLNLVTTMGLWSLDDMDMFYQVPQQSLELYAYLVLCQVALMLLVGPGLTSTAISGEREAKSLELLLSSGATPCQLVAGKVAFALTVLAALLLCPLPSLTLCYLLGGVPLSAYAGTFAAVAGLGLVGLSVGVLTSAREERSSYATLQAYVAVALLVAAGLFFLEGIGSLMTAGGAVWLWSSVLALAFNAVCLSALLLLKSADYLGRRAAQNLWLVGLLLVWYWVDCILAGVALASPYVGDAVRLEDVWSALTLTGIIFVGAALGPARLPSRREREKFSRSLFSRWPVVLVLFTLPAVLAGLIPGLWLGNLQAALPGVALLVFYLLAFTFTTRGIHLLLGGKVPMFLVHLFTVAVVCGLSSVGAAFAASSHEGSFWYGLWLSPVCSAFSLWTHSYWELDLQVPLFGAELPVGLVSVVFYSLLAAGVGIAAWSTKLRFRPR